MELFLQQCANGLIVGSTYAVVAIGFSLVFTVMRVVNMAHPDIVMIAMFVALWMTTNVMNNLLGAIFAVLIATVLVGLVLERGVLRPLRTQNLLMPLIATAGVSTALQYGVASIVGNDPRPFPELIPKVEIWLSTVHVSSVQLVTLASAFVIMVGVSYYVRQTKWGRATRAIAERPEVAGAFGVDVNRVAQITVALAAVMAGIAGVAIALMYSSAWAFVGGLYGLKSFVCMLVAGNRYLEGVIVVALTLGIIETMVTGYLSSNLRDAVAFVVLIIVLYFRPSGLFGSYNA